MTTRSDVLAALRQIGAPSTCPRIASRAGYSEPATREALRALVASGAIVADGSPRVWYLAEWGTIPAAPSAENAARGRLRADLHQAIDALVLETLSKLPRPSRAVAADLSLPPRFVALSLSRLREAGKARVTREPRNGARFYSRGAP